MKTATVIHGSVTGASGPAVSTAPGLWRSLTVLMGCVAGAAALGRAALDAITRVGDGPVALDTVVAAGVLAVGAVACTLLATGTVLLVLSALARIAGRSARGIEAAATRVTPALLRRAVAVTLTTGIGLTGAASAAGAAEIDLGWEVTTAQGSTAQGSTAPGVTTPGGTTGGQGASSTGTAAGRSALVQTVSTTTDPAGHDTAPDTPPDTVPGTPDTVAAPSPTPTAPPPGTVPVPVSDADPAPAPAPAPQPADATVVVTAGDSLWSIAAAHLSADATDADVARSWPRWYALNEHVIGSDPDLIRPGQQLLVPDEPTMKETR